MLSRACLQLELLARLVALREVEAAQVQDVAVLLADEAPGIREAAAQVVAGTLVMQAEARAQVRAAERVEARAKSCERRGVAPDTCVLPAPCAGQEREAPAGGKAGGGGAAAAGGGGGRSRGAGKAGAQGAAAEALPSASIQQQDHLVVFLELMEWLQTGE